MASRPWINMNLACLRIQVNNNPYAAPQFNPSQGDSQPMSGSVSETILFENSDTRISSARVIHFSEQFALHTIQSFRIHEVLPSKKGAVVLLLVSLLLTVLVPVFLVLAAAAAVFLCTAKKEWKILLCLAATNEVCGYSTHDHGELIAVATALTEALAMAAGGEGPAEHVQ